MNSTIVKHSIMIDGHKTSVSLEDAFWTGLKDAAKACKSTISALVTAIESERRDGNLSSAIRLYVLDYYRSPVAEPRPDNQSLHPTAGLGSSPPTLLPAE